MDTARNFIQEKAEAPIKAIQIRLDAEKEAIPHKRENNQECMQPVMGTVTNAILSILQAMTEAYPRMQGLRWKPFNKHRRTIME
jgi:hypothetical protein